MILLFSQCRSCRRSLTAIAEWRRGTCSDAVKCKVRRERVNGYTPSAAVRAMLAGPPLTRGTDE